MAFSTITRFGTDSIFNNGQVVGRSIQGAFDMGSTHFEPTGGYSGSSYTDGFGNTNFRDATGGFTGTTRTDGFGNLHHTSVGGDHTFVSQDEFGASIRDAGGIFKRIVGDSDDAMELAGRYAAGTLDQGSDFLDLVI